jgi:hypothetical protein
MTNPFKSLLIFLLSLMAFTVLAQEFEWEKPLFNLQNNLFSQKIYIHFDKSVYDAGDDLWFKAYIINPKTHLPDIQESALNVELIGTDGRIKRAEILRVENGFAFGDLKFGDSIPTGNYLFRAYTESMRGLGEQVYYVKDFFIENPVEPNYISRRQIRENRKFNRELEALQNKYIFEYFFENGHGVSGLLSRVAYLASNGVGKGIPVNGKLFNNKGDLLQSFASNSQGRGAFNFNPEENLEYTLEITFPDLSVQSVQLGNIVREGILFRIDSDEYHLFIAGGLRFKGETPDHLRNLRFTIHNRSKVHFFWQVQDFPEHYSLRIPLVDLPEGISIVSVFDGNNNLIWERNIYNPRNNYPEPLIHFEPINDQTRLLEIFNPLPGTDSLSFSISVIEYDLENYASKPGIYKDITLASEMISTQYGSKKNFSADPDDINLLMMTGTPFWHENPLFQLENQNYLKPDASTGLYINGVVLPVESSRAIGRKQFDISMKLLDDNRVINTNTNENGYFKIGGFERDGEFSAQLTIQGIDGALPGAIELFPHRSEIVDYQMNPNTGFRTDEKGAMWKRGKMPKTGKTDRVIKLPDPIETGRKGSPDQVIHLRIHDERYNDLEDVLIRSATGVRVEGNRITIRGASSILLSSQPLLMIDDQEVNSGFFLRLSPIHISHIEIYKGASSSAFGLRGANGAILAYSRRHINHAPNVIEYVFNGYQVPRVFETHKKNKGHIRTLYWHPYIKFDEDDVFKLELPEPSKGSIMLLTLNGLDEKGNFVEFQRVLNDY